MFTSWSEVSTPAELSMASVLMRPPASASLHPGPLGESEVAALADDSAPELGGIDAHRVVGAVTGVGARLGGRLHEGADPAVPEQVDRRSEDRCSPPRRA